MLRRILLVALLVLAAAAVAPSVASAGCIAAAGNAAVYPGGGAMDSNSGANCTTNNGLHYEVRIYYQGDSGGWHSVNLDNPFVYHIDLPAYQNYRWFTAIQCAYWAPADNSARVKVRVENLASHQVDTGYSPSATLLPSNCY